MQAIQQVSGSTDAVFSQQLTIKRQHCGCHRLGDFISVYIGQLWMHP